MYRLTVRAHGTADEHDLDLDRDVVLVGRRAGVDVPLPHDLVGGVHVRLMREAGQVSIVDGGLVGGASVNGQRLGSGARRLLCDGDEIQIVDKFVLRYQARSPRSTPTSEGETAALARALVQTFLGALGNDNAADALRFDVVAGAAEGRTLAIPPPGQAAIVGRGEACELVVRDPDLSREHLRVERDAGRVLVTDLGSKNGTRRGDERLPVGIATALTSGDRLELGATILVFHDPADAALKALQASLPVPVPVPVPVPEHNKAPRSEAAQSAFHSAQPRFAPAPRWPLIIIALLVAGGIAALVWLLTT